MLQSLHVSQNWYAIQLNHEAMSLARLRHVEVGALGGRYLRSEEMDKTVIARSCEQIGVDLYIPTESFAFIHRRTKARVERKRALIPGYGFVHGVTDIEQLEAAKGVKAVMTNGKGTPPTIIPELDIMNLRIAERDIARAFEAEKQRLAFRNQKLDKRKMRKLYPSGSSFTVKSGYLKGQQGTIQSASAGRKTIKAMVTMLGGLVPVEFTIDQIEVI